MKHILLNTGHAEVPHHKYNKIILISTLIPETTRLNKIQKLPELFGFIKTETIKNQLPFPIDGPFNVTEDSRDRTPIPQQKSIVTIDHILANLSLIGTT